MEAQITSQHLALAHKAVELFARQGFEETTVEQIALAAGISRSTFFRQFRSKEDVLFADHTQLLRDAQLLLDSSTQDPWLAVCSAAELVFAHFAEAGSLAQQRYEIVNAHQSLRDKELVTVFSYEHLFANFLRQKLPQAQPLLPVRFAATVIASHNFLLREFMRGDSALTLATVQKSMFEVRQLFGVSDGAADSAQTMVAVLNFPSTTPAHQIAEAVQEALLGK